MVSTRMKLLVTVLSAILIIASVVADEKHDRQKCASPQELWSSLLLHTDEMHVAGVSVEVEWCVHAEMHPTAKTRKRKCLSVRSYEKRVQRSERRCRHAHTPKLVPFIVAKYVADWLAENHKVRVPEETICCIHGRVHALFQRSQFRSSPDALLA
eukprot:IDg20822t1